MYTTKVDDSDLANVEDSDLTKVDDSDLGPVANIEKLCEQYSTKYAFSADDVATYYLAISKPGVGQP